MKKLKWGLAAIVIGEFVTLRRKDPKFKKNISKASTPLDKFKVVFDGLFDFNKSLFEDIKELDINEVKDKALTWFEEESSSLEEKLQTREKEFSERTADKTTTYISALETQYKKYEKKALSMSKKVLEEYNVQDKLDTIQARIASARETLAELEKKAS